MMDKKSWASKLGRQSPSTQPPHTQNYKDRLIRENADRVYRVKGVDITGREAVYFVLIDKNKMEAFLRHRKGDNYNLEDYGEVVYSTYGTQVPEDAQKMLKEKYGFDRFGEEGSGG